jgi:hypothetical protein
MAKAKIIPEEFLRIGKLVQATKFKGDGRDYVLIVGYISEQEPEEAEQILKDLDTHNTDRCIQLSIIRKFGFYSEHWRDGKPYLLDGTEHLTPQERFDRKMERIKQREERMK